MGVLYYPTLKGDGEDTSPNFLYLRMSSVIITQPHSNRSNSPPGKSMWWGKGIFIVVCFLLERGCDTFQASEEAPSRCHSLPYSCAWAHKADQGASAMWPLLKLAEFKDWLELLVDVVPMQVMPTLWRSHLLRSCFAVSLAPISGHDRDNCARVAFLHEMCQSEGRADLLSGTGVSSLSLWR